MSDLTDFLHERYDEEEALVAATLAQRVPGRFILRRDPSYTRADLDSKRRIVDEFVRVDSGSADHELGYGLSVAVALLAAVYADHPDYREEWRP